LKERNLLEIFVNEQCFEEQCFDNKKVKTIFICDGPTDAPKNE